MVRFLNIKLRITVLIFVLHVSFWKTASIALNTTLDIDVNCNNDHNEKKRQYQEEENVVDCLQVISKEITLLFIQVNRVKNSRSSDRLILSFIKQQSNILLALCANKTLINTITEWNIILINLAFTAIQALHWITRRNQFITVLACIVDWTLTLISVRCWHTCGTIAAWKISTLVQQMLTESASKCWEASTGKSVLNVAWDALTLVLAWVCWAWCYSFFTQFSRESSRTFAREMWVHKQLWVLWCIQVFGRWSTGGVVQAWRDNAWINGTMRACLGTGAELRWTLAEIVMFLTIARWYQVVAFNAILTWIWLTHVDNDIAQLARVPWIAFACERGKVLLFTGAILAGVHVATLELGLAEVASKTR